MWYGTGQFNSVSTVSTVRTAAGSRQLISWVLPRAWSWFVIVLVEFLLVVGGATDAQESADDQRKVDEIILLDISGSMVNDIRAALVQNSLAKGPSREGYYFPANPKVPNYGLQLADGYTIERALADPRMREVVTNNLLYKVVQYVEAIVDQPGSRQVYLATFDDGPIDMGIGSVQGQRPLPANILGPFVISGLESGTNSSARRVLKSLLAPDRNGVYEASPGWKGILSESVMKGSGPTAIHGTCVAGLKFLKTLIVAGYTNTTKLQKMILFTDGIEEKDKTIPFTQTINVLSLHRTNMAFEFNKYFILRKGEVLPDIVPLETKALQDNGFPGIQMVEPRTIRVTISTEGDSLKGELEQSEDPAAVSTVLLGAPRVRCRLSKSFEIVGMP